MQVKNNPTIILSILVLVVSGFFTWQYFSASSELERDISEQDKKIIIAACPTCYELAKKLDSEKYDLIPTASTAESVALLVNKKADMILAGRTLKQYEPDLPSLILRDGYSFLGKEEQIINESDLAEYDIYTDLDREELQEVFGPLKFQTVEDVYQYLNDGLIITSWEYKR